MNKVIVRKQERELTDRELASVIGGAMGPTQPPIFGPIIIKCPPPPPPPPTGPIVGRRGITFGI